MKDQKAGKTLAEVQSYFERSGGSDAVFAIVMNCGTDTAYFESGINLGIALLERGNPVMQKSVYNKLRNPEIGQKFLKVICGKMREAQTEMARIRNRIQFSSKRYIQERHGSGIGSNFSEYFSVELPPKINVMGPVLRFLQLLCLNNRDLQNFLRTQNGKNNYNLISETLVFLDCICGSTTGSLGLLALYINKQNISLINQTLESLTEYCQGPCHDNQNCIAMHESNGLDIVVGLLTADINVLVDQTKILELKNNASKLLLAIMESRTDTENAERILGNMNPKQMIEAAVAAYQKGHKKGLHGAGSKEMGHNLYILCHKLAKHNKEMSALLKPVEDSDSEAALSYFASHTGQIEVVIKAVHIVSIMGNYGMFSNTFIEAVKNYELVYHFLYLVVSLAGLIIHPFCYAFLLLDLIYGKETKNVIQILMKFLLINFILLYFILFVGYIFFQDDFQPETEPSCGNVREFESGSLPSSECLAQLGESTWQRLLNQRSLFMFFHTILCHGVGDILRKIGPEDPHYIPIGIFYISVWITSWFIVLNIIGAFIFNLWEIKRTENEKREVLTNSCFICGLKRTSFDNKAVTFEYHIRCEHNMWHYLFFLILIKIKDPTEFTAPESFVADMFQKKNYDWSPRNRTTSGLSLAERILDPETSDDGAEESEAVI